MDKSRKYVIQLSVSSQGITDLSDVLSRVGERDFVDLIGVKPNFSLSAFKHGGCQPLHKYKLDNQVTVVNRACMWLCINDPHLFCSLRET